MAATNLKAIDPANKFHLHHWHGTGSIAGTDDLVTDVNTYPKGSVYVDCTNRVRYERTAAAGVIGDWSKVTLTAAT